MGFSSQNRENQRIPTNTSMPIPHITNPSSPQHSLILNLLTNRSQHMAQGRITRVEEKRRPKHYNKQDINPEHKEKKTNMKY